MNIEPTGILDEPLKRSGDTGFVGVIERGSPADLPDGYIWRGKNTRMREKRVEPRLGIQLCRWMIEALTPFEEVYGVAEFFDGTDGLRWLVMAADGGVWRTRPHQVAVSVALPAGVVLTDETFAMFVQCDNTLVLLRGETEDPLACRDLDEGFTAITQTDSGDGTEPIPRSAFGLYFANRLLLIKGRDEVPVSDALDYTRYVPTLNQFRINQGDNDRLVAIAELNANTLLFLKDRSVWQVTNIGNTLSAALGPLPVTKQYGCVAPQSVVMAGTQLFWWSHEGFVSLRLTELNEVQAAANALTDDMPYTLGRINQQYVDRIRTAYRDGFIYIAVPLDDARRLGENLVPAGSAYSPGVPYTLTGLTVGVKYVFEQVSELDGELVNNGTTYQGSAEFTAGATSVTIACAVGSAGGAVTATVKEVKAEGVLNGVMVYDTVNSAWAGVDEGEAICIKSWVKTTVLGKVELFSLGYDGWLHWHEQGYEDEVVRTLAAPYVDALILTRPASGQTFRVNGGTTITAADLAVNNGATTWAAPAGSPAATAGDNLWLNNGYGYDATAATGVWSAPNTTTAQICDGVRFTSTNGSVPQFSINGGAVVDDAGFYGTGNWLFLDVHSGSEIQTTPVAMRAILRGYTLEGNGLGQVQGVELKLALSTWNPSYTLTAITDGVAREQAVVSNQTRSRSEYDIHAQAAWGETNTAGDHGLPGRQDYSFAMTEEGIALGAAGVNFDQHQEQNDTVRILENGWWHAVMIENAQGRCEIRRAQLTLARGVDDAGVKAA